jgi:DtxR family transcriptional regulator, Mn-dependent transcriptional regulator
MIKPLSSHMENYLEVILSLEEKHGHAHIKDIARKIEIKMPSVTEAIAKLKSRGLVNYNKYGTVTLKRKGREIAINIFRRHTVLYEFLRKTLKIDAKTAEEDACKIEHVISSTTFNKINKFINFLPNR